MFYPFIKTFKTLTLIVFVLLLLNSCSKQSNSTRPNILFIMADDHTSQAWGIYDGILDDYVKNNAIKYLLPKCLCFTHLLKLLKPLL